MPLGLFLYSVFHSAKQILVASFATQVRARILGRRNIFCTLGEGQQRLDLMPLGLVTPPSGRGLVIPIFFPWFFFFLVVTCPRPPVFARPNKYSSYFLLHRQGLLSWVTVTYFTPGGGGEQRRGLMPLGLFLFLFFFGGHLPQTSARPKQYLSVMFVRLAFVRQNFHESWCRQLLAIEWHKTPSIKARTKVLAKLA